MPAPAAAARPPGRDADAFAGLPVSKGAATAFLAAASAAPAAGDAAAARLADHPVALVLPPGAVIPLVLAARDRLERTGRNDPATLRPRVDAALLALARRASAGDDGLDALRAEGQRTSDLLRRLVDLSPDAVATVRRSGQPGLWNGAAAELTGRRLRDLRGAGIAALFRRPGEWTRLARDLERRGSVRDREILIGNASGETVPVRVHGAALPSPGADAPADAAADPERFLLVFHDLTEIQRIRRRLIETEKFSAMARVAGSVAHEIRNPLNSLFLSTDILEDELAASGVEAPGVAPVLTAIREEIERLNGIIKNYLSLSRLATRRPETFDLGALAAEMAAEVRDRAAAKGVRVTTDAAREGLLVDADRNQLRRVLVNLVDNALDAAAPGGRVALHVRRLRRAVKLSVRDDGCGIPEEHRDRLFEPFFTLKEGGTGLGLYLVREIVLAHGGTISLATAEGKGTAVSIRLPRATAAPAPEDAP